MKELNRFCLTLHWGATARHLLTVFTAMAAIVLSLLVATCTGYNGPDGNKIISPYQLKLLVFLSAICTALFSGFQLRSKAADLRTAYRL